MIIEASVNRRTSLDFDIPSGERFYFESGIGVVAVPPDIDAPQARLRIEPRWEAVRNVVPLIAVSQYYADGAEFPIGDYVTINDYSGVAEGGFAGDLFIKIFGWDHDQEGYVWLTMLLPISGPAYSGSFTYSVAIVGHIFPPFDLPAPDAIRAAAEGVRLPSGDH